MSEMFVRICIQLLFLSHCAYQNIHKEGDEVDIKCEPSNAGAFIFWFRIVKTGIEFVGSFTSQGDVKVPLDTHVFSSNKIKSKKSITLNKFEKNRDSGTYSCASINSNKLVFGEATFIEGLPDPKPTIKATTPPKKHKTPKTTAQPCRCQTVKSDKGGCPVVLWAPIAAACGVIFLILIIIIIHCERTRTRRCPHHYKRKPKNTTPAQQAMTARYLSPARYDRNVC